MPMTVSDARSRITQLLPQLRSDLEALVRIESVSADPARLGEVEKSAEMVRSLFEAEGCTARIVRHGADGPPAVIARKEGPAGAPTVLLYAHHDVQPENDHADWDTPPFEPTERGDRLYARGAADDKAGVIAHLAALRAFGDELPVTVVAFIEGEEEVGSVTLTPLLEEYKQELAADVIVIADSGNWDIGAPALTTSLRGLVRVDVEVRTLAHAVHSGMWGGLAPDALMALVRLLDSLYEADGSLAVEGLHSGPAADVDYPEARLRAESGALPGTQWIGKGSAVERLWTQPSLTITGIDAPKVDGASNTLTPAACAKLALRTAPGDTSANAAARLEEHLKKHAPWGAEVSVTLVDAGEATQIDATGPAYEAARQAFKDAWDGTDAVDMGVGGSIPFIAEFLESFPKASVLVTGVEDPDTRAHGPNEGLHLPEYERVLVAELLMLANLGG
ncbi:MAG: dipeptidase [Marmoricola sp.]